jgi:SulP family sulfate permease
LSLVREMLPAAFAIAMLGAIESLLSAVIADGMTGTHHNPNTELVALGVGNLIAPCFGGIAATGALARTAANIRSGARSPFSAAFHAVFVLLSVLALAPLVAFVPMAALSALLLVVAWNMAEVRLVSRILRVAPGSDVAVLCTCFALTVVFDMVVAVMGGVVFAALLFMRRMAELTQARVLTTTSPARGVELPPHVVLYEIAGPLFFGAAARGMSPLGGLSSDVRVVVFDLSRVPVIDTSGFLALESAIERLQKRRLFTILAGPLPEPKSVFKRADLEAEFKLVMLAESVSEGLAMARDMALLSPEWDNRPS